MGRLEAATGPTDTLFHMLGEKPAGGPGYRNRPSPPFGDRRGVWR